MHLRPTRALAILPLLSIPLLGTAAMPPASPSAPLPAKTLADLDTAMGKCVGDFNSEAYLELATALQALPKEQAIAQLRRWAVADLATPSGPETPAQQLLREDEYRASARYEFQVIALCRMLFEAPSGTTFRTARIIRIRPLAGSSAADWPLLPIALVDGVPFDIRSPAAMGYSGPPPERAAAYLDYCIAQMQWAYRRYAPAKPEDLKNAYDDLLASKKWRLPLNDPEFAQLRDQIKPPRSDARRVGPACSSRWSPYH